MLCYIQYYMTCFLVRPIFRECAKLNQRGDIMLYYRSKCSLNWSEQSAATCSTRLCWDVCMPFVCCPRSFYLPAVDSFCMPPVARKPHSCWLDVAGMALLTTNDKHSIGMSAHFDYNTPYFIIIIITIVKFHFKEKVINSKLSVKNDFSLFRL